jgi:hypothetical protein
MGNTHNVEFDLLVREPKTSDEQRDLPPPQAISVSRTGKLVLVDWGEARESPGPNPGVTDELYGLNWREFDNLLGRILTLCDASFTDREQRKAFKDLVRQHLKEWVNGVMIEACADAGIDRPITAPFVGGVLDYDGGLFGIEGEPTT